MPEIETQNDIAVFASNLENPYKNSSDKIKLKSSAFKVEETSSVDRVEVLKENQEISYTTEIKNISKNELNGVTAEKVIPDGVEFKEAYILKYDESTKKWEKDSDATFDENSNTVSWNLGTMSPNQTKKIKFVGTVGRLEFSKYEKEISTQTTVTADNGEKFTSAKVINTLAKPNLQVSISNDAATEYVKEGENIKYTVKIKNTGKATAGDVKFEDILPKELNFVKGDYATKTGDSILSLKENDNTVHFTTNIQPGEEITLNIETIAKDIPNNLDEVKIENYATVEGSNSDKVKTEVLTTRIEQNPTKDNPSDEDNNDNTNNGSGGNGSGNKGNGANSNTNLEKTFRIRGTAWVDANSNGMRDNGEQLLEGITVILTDANSGEVVKDKDSGIEKRTTTASDGTYVFDNLEKGNYTVIFYYNTEIYAVTEYQKEGVATNINSDVISAKVTLDGEEKLAAISDTIKLSNSSFANIDMGLINTKQFDLKLDKYISKITVQNKEGVKTYNYSDAKIGKADITSKRMIGSTIIAEYKIKVTNNGNVAGYAKSIVDYMPSQMKFNSNLNPNWYAGNDGNLYNTKLAETVINPGETKEVSLVLTKQLADTGSIIINNLAEISEDFNDLGLKDKNSTPKNQAQGEDDISSADLVITIKTGSAVTYTCLILVALVILAVVVYVLKKRKDNYYD